MKRHRKSLEEQAVLRAEITQQQKILMEMRGHRERQQAEKLTQTEFFQSTQAPGGKWFGSEKMPTEQEILDHQNRAKMLRKLDKFFKKNCTI